MKKFIFTVLIFIIAQVNSHASSKWGKGELKLDNYVVEKFIEYIRGNVSRTPYLFAVSEDGWGFNYYYCASGTGCSGGAEAILRECKKISKGVECYLFARHRTIKWKNGINPGRGKVSQISYAMSDTEIREKLTELGFLGTSSPSSPEVKNTKESKNVNDSNLVNNIKELNELYKSGVLTKEEFEKAKKKLLN